MAPNYFPCWLAGWLVFWDSNWCGEVVGVLVEWGHVGGQGVVLAPVTQPPEMTRVYFHRPDPTNSPTVPIKGT